MYSNRILGKFEKVNPTNFADILKFMDYNPSREYNTQWYLPIIAHFTQIEMPAKIIHKIEVAENQDDQKESITDVSTQFKAKSSTGSAKIHTSVSKYWHHYV